MKMSTVAIYNCPNREQPKDSMMRGKIKKKHGFSTSAAVTGVCKSIFMKYEMTENAEGKGNASNCSKGLDPAFN